MQEAIILGLRLGTIALRFALTLFVTAFLGLEATGLLGITIAITALAPALLGFGLNYHLCRDAAGKQLANVIPIARDRAAVTFLSLFFSTFAGVITYCLVFGPLGLTEILIVLLIWCETLSIEQFLLLIGLQRGVLANILIFVRSAAWVPVAMAIAYTFPAARNLDVILAFWILGHVGGFLILGTSFARESSLEDWTRPNTGWVMSTIRHSWMIWASDIALAGLVYSDRIVVSHVLDARSVGIFTLYWSFANALQTLMVSALVQPSLPKLVIMYEQCYTAWREVVLRRWFYISVLSFAAAVFSIVIIYFGFAFAKSEQFPWHSNLAILLFLGCVFRIGHEYLGVCLTSASKFSTYAVSTMMSCVIFIALLLLFTSRYHIEGAAFALVASGLVSSLFRAVVLRYGASKVCSS